MHGEAPSDPLFGARLFDSTSEDSFNPIADHGSYYDEGSVSLRNIAAVASGHPRQSRRPGVAGGSTRDPGAVVRLARGRRPGGTGRDGTLRARVAGCALASLLAALGGCGRMNLDEGERQLKQMLSSTAREALADASPPSTDRSDRSSASARGFRRTPSPWAMGSASSSPRAPTAGSS